MATEHKSRWLKWVLVIVALGACVGGGLWYFGSDHEEPPQYQTTAVSRGDLTQAVSANGTLNPVINVQVGSQISGNIQRLYADYNSLVKSNQVVAQLDPAIYQAIVHQNEGDLANAKATLELQQVETHRTEELFKAQLVSRSEFDKAVANLHQAEAVVRIKEASVERAKVDLNHCTIYAPVDGIVISRSVDVGQTVAASMNAPVLFIVANDLAKMQIDANVSEADVGTIEEGQAATFTVDAFPGRTFSGKVTQIRNSPITVQNVVTYDTVIGVNNADLKLKPGMTATVSIITAQRSGVLRIPNVALRFKPPEPTTNQTFVARLLSKMGAGQDNRPASTNAAGTTNGLLLAKNEATNPTNAADSAEKSAPALTGNEPPEELMRRVRELRERGEEIPAAARARMRELFQSGALQRPEGGSRGGGGGGGGGSRSRPAGPSPRTVYMLANQIPPGEKNPVPTPVPQRIKAGISDGSFTEVIDGLKEGDAVLTAVKLSQSQSSAAAPAANSPFGGGSSMRRF